MTKNIDLYSHHSVSEVLVNTIRQEKEMMDVQKNVDKFQIHYA
jgi:hypothetical protein